MNRNKRRINKPEDFYGTQPSTSFPRWMPYFVIILIGIMFMFSGCSLVSNSTGSEDFKKFLESSQTNKSEKDNQTTPPMVKGGDFVVHNSGSGEIKIEALPANGNSTETILRNLDADLLRAQGTIKNLTVEKEEKESKYSETIELHKTWHTVSAIVIGAKILLIIVLFVVFRSLPNALKQYGINPKKIAEIIPNLLNGMKVLQRSMKRGHKEVEYLRRKIADNHLAPEVKAELQRQVDAINTDLRDIETVNFDS